MITTREKVIMCLIIAACMVGTIYRNWIYDDTIRLNEDIVSKSPEKPRAHLNLGEAYLHNDRYSDARTEFNLAEKFARQRGEKEIMLAALTDMAVADIQVRAYTWALLKLTDIIKEYGPYPPALANLILLDNRIGKPGDAVRGMDEFLDNPDIKLTQPVLYNYAISLSMTGNCDGAKHMLDLARLASALITLPDMPVECKAYRLEILK